MSAAGAVRRTSPDCGLPCGRPDTILADALREHLSGGPDLADSLAFGERTGAMSGELVEGVALLVIYAAAAAGPAEPEAPGFTVARLAEETGASPAALVLAAADLVGRGLLEERRRRRGGAWRWELRLAPGVALRCGDVLAAAVRAFEVARAARHGAAR